VGEMVKLQKPTGIWRELLMQSQQVPAPVIKIVKIFCSKAIINGFFLFCLVLPQAIYLNK
jgi:hypothetical protein